MATEPAISAAEALRRYALSLPGASEDFPWGERVAKVGGKVFAFLGKPGGAERGVSFSVKLPKSATRALDKPFCEPTGYGLGRNGWVTVKIAKDDAAPAELLRAWIEESYRAIAPPKLIAKLDAAKAKAALKPKPAKPPARPKAAAARPAPAAPRARAAAPAKTEARARKAAPAKARRTAKSSSRAR
jgi:predicted DNA-binding protein (MmcQ/YjbR family)